MKNSTEQIFNNLGNNLKKFIRSRVNNKVDADDIFQDIFLKIHSNIDKLKYEKKVTTWIFQITRNTIIDFYKKKKTDNLVDDISFNYKNTDSIGDKMTERAVLFLINDLPDKYKQVLILTEFDNLKVKDLTVKLNISLPAAKSRILRGRKMLQDKILEFCHFEFDKYGTIIDYKPKKCSLCKMKKN